MAGNYGQVQEYYGKVLKTKADLQTSACCPAEAIPDNIKPLAGKIHPEVTEKFYGCGILVPPAIAGATILDLGSGSGRDCYVMSQLVGENGHVIGVDMTDEQLDVASKHVDYHMEKFGYKKQNVSFKKGYIEDLAACDIADNSVDMVISNCVFNLSPEKEKVFAEVFRVLKPGGELFFSDVFTDRRLSEEIQNDTVLRGECLGGAMYLEDYRRLLQQCGCADGRTLSTSPLEVHSPKLRAQLGLANFYSLTQRAFKLDLEDRCEDYGQVAFYDGSIPGYEHGFALDDHHFFVTGKPMTVCSNTANMLTKTRFAKHFRVEGDTSTHYGLFDCGPTDGFHVSVSTSDLGIGPADSGSGCC